MWNRINGVICIKSEIVVENLEPRFCNAFISMLNKNMKISVFASIVPNHLKFNWTFSHPRKFASIHWIEFTFNENPNSNNQHISNSFDNLIGFHSSIMHNAQCDTELAHILGSTDEFWLGLSGRHFYAPTILLLKARIKPNSIWNIIFG